MKRIARLLVGSLLALTAAMPPALAAGPAAADAADPDSSDLRCLALNIYFEARNEPYLGKIAVGHVVLNRVADKRFPHTICGVVKQGGDRHRNRCHFSWWCDGRSDKPHNLAAWRQSLFIAMLIEGGMTTDPTHGALWYHADYVNPSWTREYKETVKIGHHLFYAAPAAQFAGKEGDGSNG